MRLTNHIALRFLQDDKMWMEIMETHHPDSMKMIAEQIQNDKVDEDSEALMQIVSLYAILETKRKPARNFLVTPSVHEKLEMLKVKPNQEGLYDWTVFKHLKDLKSSFILPPEKRFDRGGVIRIMIDGENIHMFHICGKSDPVKPNQMMIYWTSFYINRMTNEHASYCSSTNAKDLIPSIYVLLCFVYLSENEYQEVLGGRSVGTRKNGKFKNDLTIPVTLITSKWNVTSVRTEGFQVGAHFRLQPCGPGRSQTKMILIEPFEKHGYVRRAKNESL